MRKIRLLLEYNGTAYHGWQIQKKGDTVQGILEDRIQRITGKRSHVVGASRTDAGVHAIGQVAAFGTKSKLEADIFEKALNAVLPQDIRILEAVDVEDSFHPRNDALKKTYFYIITNQRRPSVFLARYTWCVSLPVNVNSMKEAAAIPIGMHDFSAFMGRGSDIKNPEREIFLLTIEKLKKIDFMTVHLKGDFIKIKIEANGFLRHMVRNIVGTLIEIGRGRFSKDSMKEIIESCDRKKAGPTAPACGLFLEEISY